MFKGLNQFRFNFQWRLRNEFGSGGRGPETAPPRTRVETPRPEIDHQRRLPPRRRSERRRRLRSHGHQKDQECRRVRQQM